MVFFKEESFAVLIAFIFIRESFAKLYEINKQYRFTNQRERYYHIVHDDPCYECIEKVNFIDDTTELPYSDPLPDLEKNGSYANYYRHNITNLANLTRSEV